MTRLAPLSQAAHGTLGWTPTVSGLSLDGTASVPVSMDELPDFAVRFPLAIRMVRGRAAPVVPVGALQGGNTPLLDASGGWRPRIVPFALRQGPFQSVRTGERDAVFVDETVLSAPGGPVVPLFDGKGDLSDATREHLSALAGWQKSMRQAEQAATALFKARLLQPWREGETTLFAPDADALAALGGVRLAQMHETGALRLAHMVELSQALIGAAVPPARPAPAREANAEGDAFLRALREEMS
ncbi:hypothetical protein GQ651_09150 [Alphaproteobacteria bacterium GH1-50]|uniref:SapC protein n=1 Tax=Kangsaoukella pontilimi TaxID=2691042 RepID=A0A7C9IPB2_9RHOB|nr:SapC family protein [Kangsaoukella pontilimi]MXQ08010.1 hypothetical protein [Kangsaoukella pontilimi]